eukprot:TRINITY_DN43063_c0_g1_i1.p1 TRINITY_DN43063_c0_g1~~TRINITY_DN43063_c0_g1_i1.p1  ORF type:complete len:165 (-),score=6.52 TRINITY_DN43063_c0_g1_i1:33-527(-)
MLRFHSLKQYPGREKNVALSANIRLQKDLGELALPASCDISFPDASDLFCFQLKVSPDEGIYCGGSFVFRFQIPINFPHSPPKIVCLSKIFHPNIDPDGNICLNILREDWNPVLSINSTVYGIQFLFLEPNCDDPLNKDAAELLSKDPVKFKDTVQKSIKTKFE